jgi:hypothetical protein
MVCKQDAMLGGTGCFGIDSPIRSQEKTESEGRPDTAVWAKKIPDRMNDPG